MDEAAMATIYQGAAELCSTNLAFLIAEPPPSWSTLVAAGQVDQIPGAARTYGIVTPYAQFAAVYFPPFVSTDPTDPTPRPVSGAIAGIYARTDASVGVWRAPAGLEAGIEGAGNVSHVLADADRGALNTIAINAIVSFSNVGVVVWGARTLDGLDTLSSDYKYVPVRRLTSYILGSVRAGTRWAVFEPNTSTLWSALQLQIANFMNGLWRQGALQGGSPADGYFVTCDASTTTIQDIEQGVANVVIGFAPVRPAEFIVLYVQVVTATA
jgi:phage tail sheath protein FI